MENFIDLCSSSDDQLSTEETMEVRQKVLLLFTTVINMDDVLWMRVQHIQLGDVMSLKHDNLPILFEGTKMRLSTQVNHRKADARLWIAIMVNFDSSLLRDGNEKLTEAKNRWKNVLMTLETVKYMSWNAKYCKITCGLGHFQNLVMFASLDRHRYIGDFQHQEMLADFGEVNLPEELRVCSKLRSVDLSYTSLFSISEAGNKLKNLRRIDLSYNQSLQVIPDWLGENNTYLRSLNVMGSSEIVELLESILRRLNTTLNSCQMSRLL